VSWLLTGKVAGAVLQELEEANAFVVSLDAGQFWFRYHKMFADLLQLECAAPPRGGHRAAPGGRAMAWGTGTWWSGPPRPGRAGLGQRRLLFDHWPGLYLGRQAATIHALLAGFPAGPKAADAELAGLVAGDELARGSLEEAERFLGLAARGSASVPAGRRAQWQVLLGVVRLLLARQRGNLEAVAEEARRLQAVAEAPEAALPGLGEELRALALINLGIAGAWAGRLDQAQWHLEQGIALAHRTGRPYLEFTGLAHQAGVEAFRSLARAEELGRQAVELAERHGWTDDPAAGAACVALASGLVWQGRIKEAEGWVQHAERTGRPEADPAANMGIRYVRALLELARGRDREAVAAFRAAERLAGLPAPHVLLSRTWALQLHALVRLGELERTGRVLAGLEEQDRERGEIRTATAALRLAQDDPRAATAALAPVLEGSAPVPRRFWLAHAFMLEAIARDTLGDPAAAGRAVERALDVAEPDGALMAFLLQPAPGLLERHARDCPRHAALISEILSLLPAEPGGYAKMAPPRPRGAREETARLIEPLSRSEVRVLRYLPTNLPAPEVARELSLSVHTVRTHMRHIFAKLGVHRRTEAVTRARALGLLAPSPRITRPEAGYVGLIPARRLDHEAAPAEDK
jgi:LuxR family maltose regulon positive regulatory protein